jgi:hypothetical protein
MKLRAPRLTRRSLVALAMAATATTATAGLATPAFAGGGMDLQRYGCDIQAPGTWVVLRSNNVYGWRCYTGLYDLGIDVNQVCRAEYGSGSSAYYLDFYNPYTWRCR